MTKSWHPERQLGGIMGVDTEGHTCWCVMVGTCCSKAPSQHEWKQGCRHRAHCRISFVLSHCYAVCPLTRWKMGSKGQLVSVILRRKLSLVECRTRVAFLLVADSFRIQKEALQSGPGKKDSTFFLSHYQHNCATGWEREWATGTCSHKHFFQSDVQPDKLLSKVHSTTTKQLFKNVYCCRSAFLYQEDRCCFSSL